MNLAQAQQEVMDRGFDYLPQARIATFLNNAKNQFEDQWHWPWLEQVYRGPAPLPVPGLKHVLYVQDTGRGNELLGLDVGQLAQGGDRLDLPGTPAHWWLDGPSGDEDTVWVRVWPAGAATLEARVTIESRELQSANETPLIPARYHPLWIDLAVVDAYQDSDNFAAAQALRASISVRMQDVILRYETRNRQHSVLNSRYAYSQDD